ncbi:hypothetical protein CAL20_23020 [Bordetella genomosp. 4]|uniref:Uncharacterized protein n=2 Tax=Bordetella genomosp. 4 TaxID=463044 RepID=A0A261TM25_9BORD|nr:hypothetical protein CAL20_23020 [Bordetella genomosp. 4]
MATTRFLDALKVKARQSFSKEDVHDILAIQWPAGVSEANRESVVKTLSDVYLEFVVTTSSNKDLVEILSADCKPSLIARKSWDQFKSRAELEVMKGAVEKLVNAPSINIESFPEWGVLSSLNKFKLSTLSKLQSKAQEADEKLDSAQKLSDRADAIERSVSRREMEAELSEHRNQELGKKVICQLDLIDKLITDPSYIDRIEPYDDTFTSGNWDILRKLAAISLSDKARN